MADPVWLLVMFDLPVASRHQRKAAHDYREMLYDKGFSRVQFSVYAKYVRTPLRRPCLCPCRDRTCCSPSGF